MNSNGIVYAVEQTPKASKYTQDSTQESSSAAVVGASVLMAGANLFLWESLLKNIDRRSSKKTTVVLA